MSETPENNERTVHHAGGCQCGAVRFAFYSDPIRLSLCHCRVCQRAVSGPFAILAECANEDFAWTEGRQKVFKSSSKAERGFCADCGSPLSYRVIDSDIIELYVCAFDDPSKLGPAYAVGDESKLPWTIIFRLYHHEHHPKFQILRAISRDALFLCFHERKPRRGKPA